MPATIGNKTDPALSPKESEQIKGSCNNLMKKKNRVLEWRIMGGVLRGRLKNWNLSEGLQCESDAAKGRLEEGTLGSGRALQQP